MVHFLAKRAGTQIGYTLCGMDVHLSYVKPGRFVRLWETWYHSDFQTVDCEKCRAEYVEISLGKLQA